MTREIIHLTEKPPLQEVVQRTIEALRGGKLVVFPTETVYGLGALASNEEAIRRLISAKGRKSGHALPIAISGYADLRKYAPNIDPVSERLARRCWPGPMTLVLDGSSPDSTLQKLPEFVRQAIMPLGTAGFRVPNHGVFLEILRRLAEPVVLTSANLSGEPPAVNADEARVGLGDRPDLILDDGTAYFSKPSTVISVSGQRISMIREGAFPKEKIKRMTAKMILFVCTGNTCRSPMAEVLCARLLTRRLHCDLPDLEENGYLLLSAGVATFPGCRASEGACEAAKARGLSLDGHASQPVTEEILRFADHIFVMGRSHRDAINAEWPGHDDRIELLRTDGEDISDPLGGDFTVYNNCAKQIEAEIAKRLDEILA